MLRSFVLAAALCSLTLALVPAEAKAACGGHLQAGCCLWDPSPTCDSGNHWTLGGPQWDSCTAGTCYSNAFPSTCGNHQQRECTSSQYDQECRDGYVEEPSGYCSYLDGAGYPAVCGGNDEPACSAWSIATLFITPCKDGYYDDDFPGGTCRALDSNGYPLGCGDVGEPGCGTVVMAQLQITPCKDGVYEDIFGSGTCYALDGAGYPTFCGGVDELGCSPDFMARHLLTTPCKGSLRIDLFGDQRCHALDGSGYPDFCGDLNERVCSLDLVTDLGITPCKSGYYASAIDDGVCWALDTQGYPNFCGDLNEDACSADRVVQLGITPCKSGLFASDVVDATCWALDADGYPAWCGDEGEDACGPDRVAQLAITPCKPGAYLDVESGTCYVLDGQGYPTICGDLRESACNPDHVVLHGITPCKDDLYQNVLGDGRCYGLDDEAYPSFCGDLDEDACSVDIQALLLIRPCKPGLEEVPGIPVGWCDWTDAEEPELGTDVVVEPTPIENAIWGIADVHNHIFSNEGFGGKLFPGKPFYKYGVAGALDSCEIAHGPGGTLDAASTVRDETFGHDTDGWPDFDGWPAWNRATHQQQYYRWIERAHRGGLRLLVMLAVSNEVLCGFHPNAPGYSCDDMEAVDRQLAKTRELVDYVDALSGGAGQGFFQIAESPAEARALIAAGKLAVVLGLEVDTLFGCSVGRCNAASVKAELARYRGLGVRHIFPVHLWDNAFGGTAVGYPIMTLGNKVINDEYLDIVDCKDLGFEEYVHDVELSITEEILSFLQFGEQPDFPDAEGHCNTRGLTALGETLIDEMIANDMIIDVDHMSAVMAQRVFEIVEEKRYPVVAGHAGFIGHRKGQNRGEVSRTDEDLERIFALGGLAAPITPQGYADESVRVGPVPNDCDWSSKSFAQSYIYAADFMLEFPYLVGVPIGSDFNGFVHQPGPRFGDDACKGNVLQASFQSDPVSYPFASRAGSGSFWRLETGNRVWDINFDGLANVGLLPDFVEELSRVGLSDQDLEPLFRSAEAYIQMWERIERAGKPIGDINADGRVDGADYTIWADNFGRARTRGVVDGDLNFDGEVDGADYTIWADHYGEGAEDEGGGAGVAESDTSAVDDRRRTLDCGLGFEIVLIIPFFAALRFTRRRDRA